MSAKAYSQPLEAIQSQPAMPTSRISGKMTRSPAHEAWPSRFSNVKGERLEGQGKENDNTQDFFYNNAPVLELTEVDACLEIMQYRKNTFIILRVCLLDRR